jgi:hypothetical protein
MSSAKKQVEYPSLDSVLSPEDESLYGLEIPVSLKRFETKYKEKVNSGGTKRRMKPREIDTQYENYKRIFESKKIESLKKTKSMSAESKRPSNPIKEEEEKIKQDYTTSLSSYSETIKESGKFKSDKQSAEKKQKFIKKFDDVVRSIKDPVQRQDFSRTLNSLTNANAAYQHSPTEKNKSVMENTLRDFIEQLELLPNFEEITELFRLKNKEIELRSSASEPVTSPFVHESPEERFKDVERLY